LLKITVPPIFCGMEGFARHTKVTVDIPLMLVDQLTTVAQYVGLRGRGSCSRPEPEEDLAWAYKGQAADAIKCRSSVR
jgi:hypothetical protein